MAGLARTAALTAAAMIAFAANSLLCREALRTGAIDAASFTAIRLVSGAVILVALARRAASREPPAGSWPSALALTIYAIAFSAAYLEMGAGTGALILFGSVQITMIAGGVIRGERPQPAQWLGVAIALGGLVAIAGPTLHAPPPAAAALMAGAGIAWGIYSLRGRGVTRPLAATAGNFLRSVPFAAAIAATGLVAGAWVTARGAGLAIASGALASGMGYSLWYAAVPSLGATRAAVVQLSVPVIAAAGAIALLGEELTPALAGGGAAVVGGLALALVAGARR
jgi:drug/metabolite transporter (DMT)-like permease